MTDYRQISLSEMLPAMGCTEPIAIALCAAKARQLLEQDPAQLDVYCSGNVIKNVKSVIVPNTGGLAGIAAAACAGCFAGDAALDLEVLSVATPPDIARARAFMDSGSVQLHHAQDVDSLYIRCRATAGQEHAEAVIEGGHARFTRLVKNGQPLPLETTQAHKKPAPSAEGMSMQGILDFALSLDFVKEDALSSRLDLQIDANLDMAREGLKGNYGAQVGKTLMESYPDEPRVRLRAYAAAGSDARMAGSAKPVVINSGSGNQGLTVSLPLIVYALDHGLSRDQLRRGLIISNLVAVYVKRRIGLMSAFCGVVSAAAAAGAGLAWLQGLDLNAMGDIVANTLLTSGGILCDGAKASCATKIAVALENALLAIEMNKRGRALPKGQGVAGGDIDQTIANVADIAREGMRITDAHILQVMINADSKR